MTKVDKSETRVAAYIYVMVRKSAWSILFVAAAAGVGLYLSRGPWLAYREQRLKADVATRDMLKAESETRELLKEKARIDSPMGREEVVRGMGFVRQGEQPLNAGP